MAKKNLPDETELSDLARAAAAKGGVPWQTMAVMIEKAIEDEIAFQAKLVAVTTETMQKFERRQQIYQEYAQELGIDELDEKQKREALLHAALRPG